MSHMAKSTVSVPAAEVGPGAVRAALARRHGSVDVRETHISWVFLARERAYKLKKPIVLPFLDYGTPARRRRMCEEEVRLNRRLAPDIYLGVRALVATPAGVELADADDPRAVDYIVEMRRYDEARTLAALLARGELRRADVLAVASALAAFHDACHRVTPRGQPVHAVEREIDENFAELLPLAELHSERSRLLVLWRFMSAFLAAHAHTFDARGLRGRVRDCHGDLRAEHVVVDGEVRVVDCVEFDPGLRALDVGDDLAFLVMDLIALGGEVHAKALVGAYREAGGDPGDDPLVAFFASYRALVRAKVLLVRAAQHPAGSAAHGRASAGARDLLGLAERFTWRARLPLVIVTCGVPASGKSSLAMALAAASALPHLSSDVTRKRLAGIDSTERGAPEHYTAGFSRATYAELGRRAAAEVARHGGAIVDATFRHRADRDAFVEAFTDAAPLAFVECQATAAVLAQRAKRREHEHGHVSDASLTVVLRERTAWEPLDEVAPAAHMTLRTDRPVELIIDDVVALLDERLAGLAP
jgi:aminoglycoside phosphotransferase family enzyme/predicted kinase